MASMKILGLMRRCASTGALPALFAQDVSFCWGGQCEPRPFCFPPIEPTSVLGCPITLHGPPPVFVSTTRISPTQWRG